jgi:hypothetical protein
MIDDIQAAEKVLAQLADQKDRATEQVSKIAARRQVLAYQVLAKAHDAKAQDELTTLNQQLADLAVTTGDIDSAVAEARRRLDAAKGAAARAVEEGHARDALATLEDLLKLGPKLDELVKHPRPADGQEFYCQNDPPTCLTAAKLMAELVNEHLRALRLAGEATFPKCWHGAASKMDLEREFMKTITAGWPSVAVNVAPRQKTVVMPGQAPRTPQFTKIINGWGAVIRKNLAQYAQATEIAA